MLVKFSRDGKKLSQIALGMEVAPRATLLLWLRALEFLQINVLYSASVDTRQFNSNPKYSAMEYVVRILNLPVNQQFHRLIK